MIKALTRSPNKPHKARRAEGFLKKYVTVFGWQNRYIILHDMKIVIKMTNYLGAIGSFELDQHCIAADSKEREFCFYVRNTLTNVSITLAADSANAKETWMEAIQGVLNVLKSERKDHALSGNKLSDIPNAEEVEKSKTAYQARSMIYIKVISAVDLEKIATKDANQGDSTHHTELYIKLTLGDSTAKTITRKCMGEVVEWGMIFPFAWNNLMRFGHIELFKTTSSSDVCVGAAALPVLNCFDGDEHELTIPLCRTSRGKKNVQGSVVINLSCNGCPDPQQLIWRFLKEVQKLPEMITPLVPPAKLFEDDENYLESLGQITEGYKAHTHTHAHVSGGNGSRNSITFANTIDTESATNDEDEVVRKEYHTRHRSSLSEYRRTGVLDDAKEALRREKELAELTSADDSINSGPTTAPTPAKKAMSNALDLSLTPVSMQNEMTPTVSPVMPKTPGTVSGEANFVDVSSIIEDRDEDEDDDDDILSSSGFPFIFPGNEEETIEDFCMRADYESTQDTIELTIQGVLILTSFRLIFVSSPRIFSEDEIIWNQFAKYDLTTYVPIANIKKIDITKSTKKVNGMIKNVEELKIQTTECRTLHFTFVDAAIPYELLHNKAMQLIRRSCAYSYFALSKAERKGDDISRENKDGCITELGKLWQSLMKTGSYIIDACSSSEGSVFDRMYKRIHMRSINRISEREFYINAHKKIIAMVRSTVAIVPQKMTDQIWNMTDEERYELLRSDEAETAAMLEATKVFKNGKKSNILDEHSPSEVNNETKRVHDTIAMMRSDVSLAAFGRKLLNSSLETRIALRSLISSGWHAYNALDEFVRMGVPNGNWRMTVINKHYDFCSTYPQVLAIPTKIDDETIKEASKFRSMHRIPTLSWRSKLNGTTICRCSQPLVGIFGKGNTSDEALVNMIHSASDLDDNPNTKTRSRTQTQIAMSAAKRRGSTKTVRKRPYIIIDCRPQINAMANQANGKGFEQEHRYENISVQWMDIDNIHVVRQSLHLLEELCAKRSGWLAGLNNSGWLKHIRHILVASIKIAHSIAIEEISILVHCSDGWDRTPQLTSLSMLMLDPYYRTIKGFIVLIEKEWVSFGHKFQDRTGWSGDGHHDEQERSPVFIQWLDCVHQCLLQNPKDFEFNEYLLLFIARHVYSGWFGNFLFNCERDAVKYRNKMSIISIWTCVLGNIEAYKNSGYKVNSGLSIPVPSKQRIQLWTSYFCPHMDQLWHAEFIVNYASGDIYRGEGDEDEMHINGGILGTGGNGYDDNDINEVDETVVNRPWISDELVHRCTRCTVNFGLLNRKHHCRCCGNIFCDPCSNKLRIVSAISIWQTQRVCLDCAVKLDDIEKTKQSMGNVRSMETNVNGVRTSDEYGIDVDHLQRVENLSFIGSNELETDV
jgi:hypothetical protein